MLTDFSNRAAAWLLAPRCASCKARLERPLSDPVCGDCWRRVTRLSPPWCDRCGDRIAHAESAGGSLCGRCLTHPPSFSVARSAALFAGPVRELIHTFKYEKRRGLASSLARLMLEAGADVLDGADAVVPVPLHPLRSVRRGFNQADDLACCLGLPVWRVLGRRRRGPTQASLRAQDRRRNLSGAFGPVAWGMPRRLLAGLDDRTVVLVDDVLTTGATVDACAAVLIALGVRTVRVLTVARAVAELPPPPPLPPPASTLRRR